MDVLVTLETALRLEHLAALVALELGLAVDTLHVGLELGDLVPVLTVRALVLWVRTVDLSDVPVKTGVSI